MGKQNKFKHYIFTPVRILKKAKGLYVKGLLACSGRVAGSTAAAQLNSVSHLPADTSSKIEVSNTNANGDQRQSLREILRTGPVINETRVVMPMNIRNNNVAVQRRQRQRFAGYKYNRNKMSYQTSELRKMERIDEDKPCYFAEENIGNNDNSNSNLLYLYPRSCRRRRTSSRQ